MTKTYDVDGYLYTPESFFLAVITAVGPKQGTPENYPCSWKQYPFAPSGSGLDLNNNQSIMFGDYTQNKNTAYPKDENEFHHRMTRLITCCETRA